MVTAPPFILLQCIAPKPARGALKIQPVDIVSCASMQFTGSNSQAVVWLNLT